MGRYGLWMVAISTSIALLLPGCASQAESVETEREVLLRQGFTDVAIVDQSSTSVWTIWSARAGDCDVLLVLNITGSWELRSDASETIARTNDLTLDWARKNSSC